jgi:hypothetical protein
MKVLNHHIGNGFCMPIFIYLATTFYRQKTFTDAAFATLIFFFFSLNNYAENSAKSQYQLHEMPDGGAENRCQA